MEALFYIGRENRKSDFPISLRVKSRKIIICISDLNGASWKKQRWIEIEKTPSICSTRRRSLSRIFLGLRSIMVYFSKIRYQKAHLFMYMGNPSKWLKQWSGCLLVNHLFIYSLIGSSISWLPLKWLKGIFCFYYNVKLEVSHQVQIKMNMLRVYVWFMFMRLILVSVR